MTEYEVCILTGKDTLKETVIEAQTPLKAVKQAYGNIRWFEIDSPWNDYPCVRVMYDGTTQSGYTHGYIKFFTCQDFRQVSDLRHFSEEDIDHALNGDRLVFYSVDHRTGEYSGDTWYDHYTAKMEVDVGDDLIYDWMPEESKDTRYGYARDKKKKRLSRKNRTLKQLNSQRRI